MRFMADIVFSGNGPFRIPTNYRIKIASILKEAVKRENLDLYNHLWGDDKANKAKPFNFCIYIPGARHVKNNNSAFLEFDSERAGLTVSSSDPSILINMYNALLNISGKYSPFDHDVEFKHFHLEPDARFKSGCTTFRLMSPMIVRNMEERDDDKKKGREYLGFDDPGFSESLYHSVKVMCREFIGKRFELDNKDFKFTANACKMVKIHHYKEVIPAVSGTFSIQASEEVIKLIYDAGIGARRSQGFGMVEVVK